MYELKKKGFTPLEKAIDEVRGENKEAKCRLIPLLAHTVRDRKSLMGFTLVEIMVAMIILAIVVAGVMASFVSSQRFITRSTRRLQAANYAREVFELLRDGVNAEYWSNLSVTDKLDTKDWTDCTADLGINLTNLAAFGGQCQYKVISPAGQPVEGYRLVTVRIRWTEP